MLTPDLLTLTVTRHPLPLNLSLTSPSKPFTPSTQSNPCPLSGISGLTLAHYLTRWAPRISPTGPALKAIPSQIRQIASTNKPSTHLARRALHAS